MRTIERCAAQGDVLFVRIEQLPEDARELPASKEIVVAHSETGHHHVVENPDLAVKAFESVKSQIRSYLHVNCPAAPVRHQRSFDTHAPFGLGKGFWMVVRQRELTPVGWQRVID